MAGSNCSRTLPTVCRALIFAAVISLPCVAWGDEEEPAFTPSINDFGGTGLLQMPNARFHDDGEVNFGASYVNPYIRSYLTFQGFPWLEGTFRYTDIRNRLFSNRPAFSGDQTFKDRGFDLKLLLLEETSNLPQVAVGLRDIGGTTLFGSEFLVASRRYYNWDFTLGAAWGNAGTRGQLPNPLGFLSDRFKNRTGSGGAGGVGLGFFQGDRISVFGGIEYLTPIDGFRLKLEYDGNDYQKEPLGNRFDSNLPINFGAEYDLFPWFRVAAAFERGNEFMIRGSVHANLNTDKGPHKDDLPPPPVPSRKKATKGKGPDDEADTWLSASRATETTAGKGRGAQEKAVAVDMLFDKLEGLGFEVSDIAFDGDGAIVRISVEDSRPTDASLAEAALAVARSWLTGLLDSITFISTLDGEDLSQTSFKTAALERSKGLTGSAIALVEPPGVEWALPFELFDPSVRIANGVFSTLEKAGLDPDEISIDGSRVTIRLTNREMLLDDEVLSRLAHKVGENIGRSLSIDSITFIADGTSPEAVDKTFALRTFPRTESQITRERSEGGVEFASLSSQTLINYRGPQVQISDRDDRPIQQFAADVFAELKKFGFRGEHLSLDGSRASLYFSQGKYRNPAKALGRAARIVARHAPRDVEQISLVLMEIGIPVLRTTILRKDLERSVRYASSPEEIWQNATIEAATLPEPGTGIVNEGAYPEFGWSVLPRLRQHVGGPDNFYFYQIWAQGAAVFELAPGLIASGSVGINGFNNFDSLKLKSNSVLPHVRSDIAEYLKEGKQWIGNLHVDYINELAPEWYGRLSAGLFELMFGGVGGEILHRPVGKRWAAGVDLNYVRQRDFDGRLGFQDYDVVTGHVSYYHRLPFYDILATVRAGRYLAKDWGATLELSRTFENGTSVGVFATKTNVSAEEFGEGKFDKGFFISVPLDLFFTSPTRQHAGLTFRPLTRDGGQFLGIARPLYWVTEPSGARAVGRGWAELLQ